MQSDPPPPQYFNEERKINTLLIDGLIDQHGTQAVEMQSSLVALALHNSGVIQHGNY